jgi:hypothetical protein
VCRWRVQFLAGSSWACAPLGLTSAPAKDCAVGRDPPRTPPSRPALAPEGSSASRKAVASVNRPSRLSSLVVPGSALPTTVGFAATLRRPVWSAGPIILGPGATGCRIDSVPERSVLRPPRHGDARAGLELLAPRRCRLSSAFASVPSGRFTECQWPSAWFHPGKHLEYLCSGPCEVFRAGALRISPVRTTGISG